MRNASPYHAASQNAIKYNDHDSADEDEEIPDQNFNQNGNFYNFDDSKRHPKKRKMESFVANNSSSRREMWNEEDSFVLLEVWGERYMELGRRSLRGEDWVDVSEKLSEMSGVEREVADCRSQMDVMKNKYKKEIVKIETGQVSNWSFFKKMDVLLNLRTRGHCGLGCGVDSGEYVFMNPRVYLDRSNVLDEMRDSPAESDEEDNGDDDFGRRVGNVESAKLLANSIQRFGEVYEKIEENKRKQMMDLEKMRQDFQIDLEMQKKQIVDRAQAEIAKIREMDDDDGYDHTDTSVDNLED